MVCCVGAGCEPVCKRRGRDRFGAKKMARREWSADGNAEVNISVGDRPLTKRKVFSLEGACFVGLSTVLPLELSPDTGLPFVLCATSLDTPGAMAERGSVQYQSKGETTEWEVSLCFDSCLSCTALCDGGVVWKPRRQQAARQVFLFQLV